DAGMALVHRDTDPSAWRNIGTETGDAAETLAMVAGEDALSVSVGPQSIAFDPAAKARLIVAGTAACRGRQRVATAKIGGGVVAHGVQEFAAEIEGGKLGRNGIVGAGGRNGQRCAIESTLRARFARQQRKGTEDCGNGNAVSHKHMKQLSSIGMSRQ